MSIDSCPTIEIQCEPSEENPSGIVVINEIDFDKATMKKVVSSNKPEPQVPPVKAPPVEVPAEPSATPKAVAPWAAK